MSHQGEREDDKKRKEHPTPDQVPKALKTSTKNILEMTKDDIGQYFHLPIAIACIPLNTEVEMLTKRCRELGIKRWPYNARKEKKSTNKQTDEGKYFSEFQVTKPIGPPVSRKPERIIPRREMVVLIDPSLQEKLPSFSELMGNIVYTEQEQKLKK